MIARRNGTCSELRPIAASVPKLTDRSVATGAMASELRSACCQPLEVKKSS